MFDDIPRNCAGCLVCHNPTFDLDLDPDLLHLTSKFDHGLYLQVYVQGNCADYLVTQEANFVEEMEDSPDFWSGPVQSYNSPVQHRFLIGLDRSTNGLLLDCDRKYVSVRTMPPGNSMIARMHKTILTAF